MPQYLHDGGDDKEQHDDDAAKMVRRHSLENTITCCPEGDMVSCPDITEPGGMYMHLVTLRHRVYSEIGSPSRDPDERPDDRS